MFTLLLFCIDSRRDCSSSTRSSFSDSCALSASSSRRYTNNEVRTTSVVVNQHTLAGEETLDFGLSSCRRMAEISSSFSASCSFNDSISFSFSALSSSTSLYAFCRTVRVQGNAKRTCLTHHMFFKRIFILLYFRLELEFSLIGRAA